MDLRVSSVRRTASDTEIAARLLRHIATVCIRRQKLGIPNPYWQGQCGRQRVFEKKVGREAWKLKDLTVLT